MLVLEAKLKGKDWQYEVLEEAIRTANFVRNKALRYWMDNRGVSKNDLQKLCATLAKEYDWAGKLNTQARQSSADIAWNGISRFYINCRENKPGKKGYPKFKKGVVLLSTSKLGRNLLKIENASLLPMDSRCEHSSYWAPVT
jgi:putative transposase